MPGHAATDRTRGLRYHNILFGAARRGTFDEIVHKGRSSPDPAAPLGASVPGYRDELVRTLEARAGRVRRGGAGRGARDAQGINAVRPR